MPSEAIPDTVAGAIMKDTVNAIMQTEYKSLLLKRIFLLLGILDTETSAAVL